jgi:putative hemolysin
MGAQIQSGIPGVDQDEFDGYCEHLLVRAESTAEIIGTYRVLTPAQAKRVGAWYSDAEFDLSACGLDRSDTVELGRSCIHADHRNGPVLMMLWSALVRFLAQQRVHQLVGCTSIPLNVNGVPSPVGLAMAANVYRHLEMYLVPIDKRALPRVALPIEALSNDLPAQPPALLRGYLRLGARLLGAPCWDAAFNTADVPVALNVQDLPLRFRREYLANA